MSGGAIMQLVAYGEINTIINANAHNNTNNNHSFHPCYREFPESGLERVLNISRTGDQWKPEYIVIEQSDEEIKLKKIYLKYNNQKFMEFDINFMRQIFPDMVRIRNNKVIYHINFDKFYTSGYMNSICLDGCIQLGIQLTNDSNVNSIKLMNDYKYLDIVERQQIRDSTHNHIVLQHQKIEKESNNTTETINFRMSGTTQGFFIEVASGIKNIKNLTINLNNIEYRNLDEIQLEYLGKIINGNMIYLPLSHIDDYFSISTHESLNMTRMDRLTVIIDSEETLGHIRIHALGTNVLNYREHMLYLRYTYHPTILNIISINSSSTTQISFVLSNKIYTGDDICLISLLDIEPDMEYMECDECSKAFVNQHLNEWFKTSKSCPHCRKNWTSNKIYKNCEPEPIQLETNNNIVIDDNDIMIDDNDIMIDDNDIIVNDNVMNDNDTFSRGFLSRIVPFIAA